MTAIPRTFCISLKETPKRKKEAIKYLNQVGLKVEFFDGIHGESFGLKTTIPNYSIIPGREYFITSGAVGCILSHLMLWNILINQPEDEFLIIEDDIQLCDNFYEKFTNFKLSLPKDWQIAYVGYLMPENKEFNTISDEVISLKPLCTHAYLVKKSALKILIETNQLAWSPLDTQMRERTLSKLKYYASNPSLISQRSVFNLKDDTWYSLCYDWDLNPEWLGNLKSNTIRLGNGWYPLEKNDQGYMIWSDGRGEFIFDDKWEKMEIEFIIEGEMEKQLKVICPSHPDQTFDISNYGTKKLSFPINGTSSVILVTDTFRPIDIFKTSDSRKLGIRLLKGITLTDSNEKSTFVSLYSMYGAKKSEEMTKVGGITPVHIKYSHNDGKINLRGQYYYNHHRSGLGYLLNILADYHREDAIIIDSWLERTFAWEKDKNIHCRFIPYREPWVGIFHHPPNMPNWFSSISTPYAIIQSKEFQESLPLCNGLYVFTEYHKKFLECFIKTVPIEIISLPTEIPTDGFSMDKFINNIDKKIINIGYWLRKISSIYRLNINQNFYQKIRLLPPSTWVPSNIVETTLDIEQNINNSIITEDMKKSVIDVRHMPNNEYDDLLSKNILFLDLYDASANNTVIEAIARSTPILVNPLPGVIEHLGEKYPFYFSTLEEASKKASDISLIKETSEYLKNPAIYNKITKEYFLSVVKNGNIWKSLN